MDAEIIPFATYVIQTLKGPREVCEEHGRKHVEMSLELTEEQKANTIVFLVRKDSLFDLLHHPKGYLKFGLSKRERDAYTTANPKYEVKEVRE